MFALIREINTYFGGFALFWFLNEYGGSDRNGYGGSEKYKFEKETYKRH